MTTMTDWGVAPGIRIYNTLLSRTKSGATEEAVLSEMKSMNIKRDNVTYDILMRRTDFYGRKGLLGQLVADGLHPRSDELNLLMSAAGSEDEADEVIDIANELEIGRNWETYALLAPFKARPGAFLALVDDMIEDGMERNSNFYVIAIERVGSFTDACFLFGRMRNDRLAVTTRILDLFARMIRLPAASLDGGRHGSPEEAIISLIRQAGTPADIAAAEL